LNSPIVKAYLKEDLRQWLWRASRSRLEPFKELVQLLRTHSSLPRHLREGAISALTGRRVDRSVAKQSFENPSAR
jgi:hypothetical protein